MSTAAIDPRIRARRVRVKKAAGRRRLRRLLLVVVLVAVVLGAYVASRSPLLDVDHVDVVGGERSGADVVVAAAAVDPDAPMVSLDLASVETAVEALPWVAEADVERRWPNRLEISVTEYEPLAVADLGGRFLLIAADGTVLQETSVAPSALPTIRLAIGDAGDVEPGATLGEATAALGVAGALTPDLAAWVAAIESTDGHLELDLVGGARAVLGAADSGVDDRLVSLATVLGRVDLECLAVVDLTVPRSPVVRRDPACLVAAERGGTDDAGT